MIPVDPLTATIGFLVYMAFRKQNGSKYGQMTPEREEVFKNAMEYLKDPQRMQALAEEFQKEGLRFQAFLLRKRAQWRARPAEVRAAHEEIFGKAMASENIKAILDVAKAFEEMTATVKAKQLRDHAADVHQAKLKAKEVDNAKRNGASSRTVVPKENAVSPESSAQSEE